MWLLFVVSVSIAADDPCGPGDLSNLGVARWSQCADFAPACAVHDTCYSACLDADSEASCIPSSRRTCDERFLGDLRQACDESCTGEQASQCHAVAELLHLMVRVGGRYFYGQQMDAFRRYLETLDEPTRVRVVANIRPPTANQGDGLLVLVETHRGLSFEFVPMGTFAERLPAVKLAFLPFGPEQSLEVEVTDLRGLTRSFLRGAGEL